MENTVSFHRFYLKESIRKYLGINLKKKKIYLFIVNNRIYLSTDTVPKHKKTVILIAKIGFHSWFVDLPIDLLPFIPNSFKLLNVNGKVLELVRNEKIKKNKKKLK